MDGCMDGWMVYWCIMYINGWMERWRDHNLNLNNSHRSTQCSAIFLTKNSWKVSMKLVKKLFKNTRFPFCPSHPQPLSLRSYVWSWSSQAVSPACSSSSSSSCPAGGARKRDRGSCKTTWKLLVKKEKTPLRGKTESNTKAKEDMDRETNRRNHVSSLSFYLSLYLSLCPTVGKRGMWCSFLRFEVLLHTTVLLLVQIRSHCLAVLSRIEKLEHFFV